MEEALIAVAVLLIGVVVGAFFQPTEAQLRPLSPEQIKGPRAAHTDESGHYH